MEVKEYVTESGNLDLSEVKRPKLKNKDKKEDNK